jgi:hypothetical protein
MEQKPTLSCNHFKSHIAEREFYYNQKNQYKGTRLICKKCGENLFIIDSKKQKIKQQEQ